MGFGFSMMVGIAVCPLTAIIGEDRMNLMRAILEKPLEKIAGGFGAPVGVDLKVHIACCPIDSDKGIKLLLFNRWQKLDVTMGKAKRAIRFKPLDTGFIALGPF